MSSTGWISQTEKNYSTLFDSDIGRLILSAKQAWCVVITDMEDGHVSHIEGPYSRAQADESAARVRKDLTACHDVRRAGFQVRATRIFAPGEPE